MIFSSLEYLLFLPIVVLLYWRTKGTARLWLLIGASYFFYMSWLPIYGILLFSLSFATWILGIVIHRFKSFPPRARYALLAGLLINLGCLCYFKYTNFILSNLHELAKIAGWSQSQSPALNIILPLGISFFAFEFIHYLVDVYKGSEPLRSWGKFAAFASFFPSQIAGPIKRYQDFNQRLENPEPLTMPLFSEAMTLILQGLFKKTAIADPLGIIVAPAYAGIAQLSCLDAMIATIGFSIQIFCDFSGYTDIGRGSALLLGIRLPPNFDLPYLAQDLAQFWRRWHISLSTWIRDYVYIPLGGSKVSKTHGLWNLFLTMSICGLWHGAAWQFIVWGSSHGLGLIANRLWRDLVSSIDGLEERLNNAVIKGLNTLVTFAFVALIFVLFRAPDFSHAVNIWISLFRFTPDSVCLAPLLKSGLLAFAAVYVGYWLACDWMKQRGSTAGGGSTQLIFQLPGLRIGAWTAAVLLMLAAKPIEATPFIYFQF